ncbi:hypothetical protein GCM10011400_66630 [Paraburkholderia caffeinilytica]|uniref:Uncharacterized protein n=2 Tax=Paraburkholderia caffeinilytica TaxID=1761016 RepID=A0ABQ1NC13_9BURK|nr:hypothetical protein GCM10011400_66630 [Paraburkholderia caffeinilytica]
MPKHRSRLSRPPTDMTSTRLATARLTERACHHGDAHAALALLDQSIELRHRRIALIRYLLAQQLGAPLQSRHHEYVEKIAARLSADALARIAGAARARLRP